MWLFASQATTHRCDVILNEVRIRGSGLLLEAFRGKGELVVGWKRKGNYMQNEVTTERHCLTSFCKKTQVYY